MLNMRGSIATKNWTSRELPVMRNFLLKYNKSTMPAYGMYHRTSTILLKQEVIFIYHSSSGVFWCSSVLVILSIC